MASIFISYRRSDSAAGYAHRLADELRAHFGQHEVFRDIKSIPPGTKFGDFIRSQLASCDVMLVIIGRFWLEDRDGTTRLHDPDDWVRLELKTALERDITVVPVLIGDAVMPSAALLPQDVKGLVERNTYRLPEMHWREAVAQLIETLEGVGGVASARESANASRESDTIRPSVGSTEGDSTWFVQLKRRREFRILTAIVASVTGVAGLISAVDTIRDRLHPDTEKSVSDAWALIAASQGKSGDLGRSEALDTLLRAGVRLTEVDLSEATLPKIDLSCAHLDTANLSGANLEGAKLQGAVLWRTNLTDAKFSDADLEQAELTSADLRRTQLTGVNLRRASLKFADLRGADLTMADLAETSLYGARLEGARFRSLTIDELFDGTSASASGLPHSAATKGLDASALSKACIDATTLLPFVEGFSMNTYERPHSCDGSLAVVPAPPPVIRMRDHDDFDGLAWCAEMYQRSKALELSLQSYMEAQQLGLDRFDFEPGTLYVKVPDGWSQTREEDVDFLLLGPESDGRMGTRVAFDFFQGEFQVDEEGYRKGRTKWVEGKGGSIIDFLSYDETWARAAPIHTHGYAYVLPSVGPLVEYSHWMTCGDVYLLFKVIVPRHRVEFDIGPVNLIRDSFSCEKPARLPWEGPHNARSIY